MRFSKSEHRKAKTEHNAARGWINGLFMLAVLTGMFLTAPALAKEPLVLVALGDSLTAGAGLAREDAFPAKLQQHLASLGIDVIIENAGVSGDTTADGLARLDWSVGPNADAVLIELGANDGLRGLPPEQAYKNLETMLLRLRDRKLPVMLAGMRALRNLGPEYTSAFDGIYPRLSEKYTVPLYPFFLEGVAADPKYNQPDMLHPNEAGVDVIVRNIAPHVIAFLKGL